MVTVCWFYSFWCRFNLVKQVKFGVSRHLLENAWREWPEILHTDVSWPPSELFRLWARSVDFSNFGTILTSKLVKRVKFGVWVKFGVSGQFGQALWIFLIMMPLWLKLLIFGVSGHYLENSVGKCRGGAEAYFQLLLRVLSSLHSFTIVR